MGAKEMLEKVQSLKELTIINGFERPLAVDEFFYENWMQILDILDDALYEHLNKQEGQHEDNTSEN